MTAIAIPNAPLLLALVGPLCVGCQVPLTVSSEHCDVAHRAAGLAVRGDGPRIASQGNKAESVLRFGQLDREGVSPAEYPGPLGTDFSQGWLDPWPHRHFSRRGTPFVHLFSLEPAFLDRDFFLDYRFERGKGEDHVELEAELEWALTRRIGLVVEAPYTRVDPSGAIAESGFGDIAIAPRGLLVELDTFLLSGNLEVSIPTGDDRVGLGSGEMGLAPSLSAWFDFGNWVQASLQVGTEHGLDTKTAELFCNAAVAYSFLGPAIFEPADQGVTPRVARHFPAGLTSVIFEFTGRDVLNGVDEGRDSGELLFGLSHSISGSWEVRAGYQVPIGAVQEFDQAFVFSLISHF